MREFLVQMQPQGRFDIVTMIVEADDILSAMVKARQEAGLENVKLHQFRVNPVNPEKDNSENN